MPTKRKSGSKVCVESHRIVYRGPVFQVTSDRVREPGGISVRRDIVRHPGSVVIMPVDDAGEEPRVLLARQYRYAVQGDIWELAAGRIDEGEPELAAAKRELLEETGYTADRWQRALYFYVSPGFLDETMAIYLARGLRKGKAQPEEDEFIRKRFFPLSAAVRMVMTGRLQDAKTIAAVLWLQESLAARNPRR